MAVGVEELRQVPIFAPLAADDLKFVAAVTFERRYGRGDIIVVEGDSGGALCYVRSGLVSSRVISATTRRRKATCVREIAPIPSVYLPTI